VDDRLPMYIVFDGNDGTYQDWLAMNSGGFVVNVRRNLSPKYMVLHRASCATVSKYGRMSKQGGFTERSFIKVCASDTDTLRAWARRHGRADGTFSKECSLCIK
jgi:hypothetical protein